MFSSILLALVFVIFSSFGGVDAARPYFVQVAESRLATPLGEVSLQDEDYNKGRYGRYVSQAFKSTNVTVPRLNMMNNFTQCDDGSLLFVTPRGEAVEHPTAVIYDPNGNLVWTPNKDFGQIYNFQVQQYQGKPHLTFWAGDNTGGHGDGFYYMFDQHYNLVRTISGGNGFGADLHSFTILPGGTALMTIYEKVETDLAGVLGKPAGSEKWMWDCIFQEFDLETGEVLFEWRASDHFSLAESYTSTIPASNLEPWDWFHINSVEKDDKGNFLISARHLRCIAYVSGETGDVLWKLGGMKNMFDDFSEGQPAARFVGQHDAHWDGDKFITFFDNRADWNTEFEHVSKGKRVEIDTVNMTVKLDQEFIHPENIFAFSQGSYQTLPNGNVLLGYGYTGAVAEYSHDGELLCDAYIQPSSRFSSGDVQSYRNLKYNWTGLPTTKPDVVVENNTLYVSWLGSTEVRSWMLLHSDSAGGFFRTVKKVEKAGFETEIRISEHKLRRYLRVVALDKNGKALATSNAITTGDATGTITFTSDTVEFDLDNKLYNLGTLLGWGCIAMILVLLILWKSAARRTPQGACGILSMLEHGIGRQATPEPSRLKKAPRIVSYELHKDDRDRWTAPPVWQY